MNIQTKQISLSLLILAGTSGCNYHVPDVSSSTSQGDDDQIPEVPEPPKDGTFNMASEDVTRPNT